MECDLIRVHIVAQWANRYIVVFHIVISYDIYLSVAVVKWHCVIQRPLSVSYWRPSSSGRVEAGSGT